MPAQRVLSTSMLLMAMLFTLGCGSDARQAGPGDRSSNEPVSTGEQNSDVGSGQQIADLPPDIREVGSPDIVIIPKPPKKKSVPKNSVNVTQQAGAESTGSVAAESGEGSAEIDTPAEMSTEEAVADAENSPVSPPPPPIPVPAGSIPVRTDEQPSQTQPGVTQPVVIHREGMTKEHKGFSSEQVFFATNREPSGAIEAQKDPDLFFGDEHGDLSYGLCEISIPYKRAPGTLPEPSIWSLEFTQDPRKHVVLMEIQRLPDSEFWMQLRSRVDASPNRQLMLFVHGYCATFRDAARRTAQMAYDMNYQGPAMFFSWPAGSDLEGFQERANYLKDLRRAEESDEDLITVIENVSRLSGAERVHLVAHSMGNFVLTEALKIVDDRRDKNGQRPRFFDQVVMAAPDIDARDFVRKSGHRVRGFSNRFTVYASRQDKALKLSKSVNGFEPLGLLNDYSRQGAEAKLYELVDASTAESSWFDSGHVYYGDMPEMLIDLAFVFRGIPATSLQRGLGETPPLFRLTSRASN